LFPSNVEFSINIITWLLDSESPELTFPEPAPTGTPTSVPTATPTSTPTPTLEPTLAFELTQTAIAEFEAGLGVDIDLDETDSN
jgi:hypothetical protein